jgi:hypothetical protein
MASRPISANCNLDFLPAYHESGTRRIQDIDLFVLHDTESAPGSARNIAAYFQSSGSGGSAHLVVDDNDCYRCLNNNVIPWAAPPCNTNGFHIEQCGYAKWSKATWLLHIKTIRRAAYKIAQHKKQFKAAGNNIPLFFVDAAGLKAGQRGITTHAEITKAFGKSTHTDPGTGYPTGLLCWLARRYYKQMTA